MMTTWRVLAIASKSALISWMAMKAMICMTLARLVVTVIMTLAVSVMMAVRICCRSIGLVKAIKADLALFVYIKHLYLDFITYREHILNFVDMALCNAGHMQQAIFARQELNKGTKGLDADNAACILFAHLRDLHDLLDALSGLFPSRSGARDKDGSVLLDVDRRTRVLLYAANDLAA